jgi:hypothetical protein
MLSGTYRSRPHLGIGANTLNLDQSTPVNSSYGPLRGFGIVSVVTLAYCLAASLVRKNPAMAS